MNPRKIRPWFDVTILSISLSLMMVAGVKAQSIRPIDPNLVPRQGKTVSDFVPKGWKIQERIEGDINSDRIPDTAFTLIESDTTKERARAFVVLLKQANGNLRRLAVANKFLLCASCGGAISGVDGTPSTDIKIQKGVITVSQLSGSRFANEIVHRFWLDKPSQRLVLIGKDVRDFDRATGDETLTSENYLTGQRIVSKYRKSKLVSQQKSQIPKQKQFIETVAGF